MSDRQSNRIGPQAAAAIAGVTAVALGCSSAEDAINDLVEDNVTLEDTLGQASDVNLDIPPSSSSALAGQSIMFMFNNNNEVLAIAPDGVAGGNSVDDAPIMSDLFNGRFTATVTFTNGFLVGETLTAVVEVDDGEATVTLTLGAETVQEIETF